MKNSTLITSVVMMMFTAFVQTSRAEGNLYEGGSVEARAARTSPEKTAYLKAQREEHQCAAKHKTDSRSACSDAYQATVRAQQHFGRFLATGEHTSQFRLVSTNASEPEQADQEWQYDVIKAIVARDRYLTPAQKAQQLRMYKYSHSCAAC